MTSRIIEINGEKLLRQGVDHLALASADIMSVRHENNYTVVTTREKGENEYYIEDEGANDYDRIIRELRQAEIDNRAWKFVAVGKAGTYYDIINGQLLESIVKDGEIHVQIRKLDRWGGRVTQKSYEHLLGVK